MRSTVSAAGLISLCTKRSHLRPWALIKASLPPISKGAGHELTSSIYDSGGNTWQANDMILEELHDGHVMMHQIDTRVDDSVGPCMDWLSSPLGEL